MGHSPASSASRILRLGALSLVLGVLGVRPAWADGAPAQESEAALTSLEAKVASALAPAEESEEQRLRRERTLAFARQRVSEILERKRAAALADKPVKHRPPSPARAARAAPTPSPKELPEIVDHESALQRQLVAGWGWGADRDHQVRVPLPDYKNWQRVRLFGIEHLAAFRYTKQHHTLTAAFTVETTATRPSSLSCMDAFERRGMPELKRHGVRITPISQSASRWDERPVLVHKTEGKVTFLFSRYEFSAAWTAYPAYDHGCLVYATVVLWDGQPDLARRLLDRFVAEGVGQVRPLTSALPARKDEDPAPAGPAAPARAVRLGETARR